jgi:hypothetical protein
MILNCVWFGFSLLTLFMILYSELLKLIHWFADVDFVLENIPMNLIEVGCLLYCLFA